MCRGGDESRLRAVPLSSGPFCLGERCESQQSWSDGRGIEKYTEQVSPWGQIWTKDLGHHGPLWSVRRVTCESL